MTFKKTVAAAMGLGMLVSGAAYAEKGDWLARARIIQIAPQASSDRLNLNADNQTTLELDFSYFVTRNVALELILATKKHNITSNGARIGEVAHLPPTLTVQYHFAPEADFRPYVGAGLNYTRFYDVNLSGGTLTTDKSSWGPALQLGADIPITKKFFFNVDVKKLWIKTDIVNASTRAVAANFKIDPVIYGVGVGMKF